MLSAPARVDDLRDNLAARAGCRRRRRGHSACAASTINGPSRNVRDSGFWQYTSLPCAAGLDDHDRVPMVGRRDVNGVDVFSGQQFAKVVVRLRNLCCLYRLVDACPWPGRESPCARRTRPRTARRYDPGTRLEIAAAHIADADAAHHDTVAGGRRLGVAERRRRNDVGSGDGGAGRAEEFAASRTEFTSHAINLAGGRGGIQRRIAVSSSPARTESISVPGQRRRRRRSDWRGRRQVADKTYF